MIDILVSFLLIFGAILSAIGALGLVRMPDVLIRMHSATKIGTLACGLIVAGTIIYTADGSTTVKGILIILFILLTAPIASHMIGRATVSTGVPLWIGKRMMTSEEDDYPTETAWDHSTDAGLQSPKNEA